MPTTLTSVTAVRPSPGREVGGTLAWVSWLRCLAILGVLAIHAFAYGTAAPGAWQTVGGAIATAVNLGFVWAVPVFVMLAGAFALDPERFHGPAPFLRRRLRRLLPPLLFWHLVYVLMLVTGQTDTRFVGPWHTLLLVLSGRLAWHLYFFFIILGLTMLTPVLVRWTAAASRREVVLTGLALALLVPVARVGWLVLQMPDPTVFTALTWWLPFLGYYVLGWGLRGIRLRGARLGLVSGATLLGLALAVLTYGQRPPVGGLVGGLAGGVYYGFPAILAAVGVYLLAQVVLAPDGVLHTLAQGPALAVADTIGRASMGIFAVHMVPFYLLRRYTSLMLPPTLLGAVVVWLILIAVSVAVTLLARRVRLLRPLF